jgi:kynurenine formamidase
VTHLLKDCPKNWGKWGPNDEVGSLNYLQNQEVLNGAKAIRQGKVFTLAVKIGDPKGDPVWPGRSQAIRVNTVDKGHYLAGKGIDLKGGGEYADDMIFMYLQGSTQYDALGHVWCDSKLWNGFDAKTTAGVMTKASVLPIAEKGIVGRGILLDIARLRGKKYLDKGESFDHQDLLAAAAKQGVTIEKRDILVIRTGWIGSFYGRDKTEFYKDFCEPGLVFSKELVEWFRTMEIPNLVTDTIANERTFDAKTGIVLPLHNALMRNLGVAFTEICNLDALAEDCAKDGQYTFMYTAAPLKVVGGTGAPANPVVVK